MLTLAQYFFSWSGRSYKPCLLIKFHGRGDRPGRLFRFLFPKVNQRAHRLGRLLALSHQDWGFHFRGRVAGC